MDYLMEKLIDAFKTSHPKAEIVIVKETARTVTLEVRHGGGVRTFEILEVF